MKITLNTNIKDFFPSVLGCNILDGLMPEVVRNDGINEPLTCRIGQPKHLDENFTYINSDGKFTQHVDIDSTAYSLIYDLGKEMAVDGIYIASHYNPNTNYTVGKFRLYASHNREDLFDDCNMLVDYDNEDKMEKGKPRNCADFYFDTEDCSFRYFAFKQLSTNSPDEITRMRNIGLYSAFHTTQRTYIEKLVISNYLSAVTPEVNGEKILNLAAATDGLVFDDSALAEVKDAELTFNLDFEKTPDLFAVITKGEATISAFGDEEEFRLADEKTLEHDRIQYIFKGDHVTKTLTLKFKGGAVIDQIAFSSDTKSVFVNTDEIITEDFLGLGANVIPTHLFEGTQLVGFKEQYMELEKRRLAVAHPNVVRVWFQVDWFVLDGDDYLNHKYTFNTPKMQAVWKELDAFKAAGIEVELNFGWKVGFWAQSWFAFPDVLSKRNSAPRDLDSFAYACSACVREMIVNRGYDNIKYLTFYNEANGGATENGWDFVVPPYLEVKDYWRQMLEKCDERLRADGLRDLIKIWAAETSGNVGTMSLEDCIKYGAMSEWVDYFNKNVPDKYEYASVHIYNITYNEAKYIAEKLSDLAGNHPVCFTEFAVYNYGFREGIDFSFERNNIANVLGFINGGAASMLFWILSGTHIDECFFHNGAESSFWLAPTEKTDRNCDVNGVTRRFYEMSLITNYMPCHSKVVKTSTPDSDTIHTAAVITPDGEYTVGVELKEVGDCNRKIDIKFDKPVNKKFYKHLYRFDIEQEGNMVIPPVVDTIEVTDTLQDTLDEKYSFAVYTTMPPKKQVVFPDGVLQHVKRGEQKQLRAEVIDGDGTEKIKWSVCDCLYTLGYPGTITEDGLYTAMSNPIPTADGSIGSSCCYAVKAELPTGEYGICLMRLQK